MNDVRDEYFELLRFQTVGADPAHLRDCAACATWLKGWLSKLGFTATLVTEKFQPPVVFAERPGAEGAPTAMLYGHYDVQPPDPIDLWETPPFEPTEKDGRVYCRGAQDDKGQFFSFLCGLRDLVESGAPLPALKIVLDGQEESGSGALFALLDRRSSDTAAIDLRKFFRADVLLVSDTSAAADLRPAIVAGLRGVTHFTLRLAAAARDLHSGSYGGIAPNPAQGMCELLASLHTPDGMIAVPGFLDGVEPPTDDERKAAEAAAASDADYERDIGCPPVGGELGKTVTERNSFRPTIEVNGVHSGYGGPGSKTVIPCDALAKISMRLVPGQDPKRAMAALEAHLKRNLPRGMRMAIEDVTGEAAGFRLPLASPLFRLAADLLGELDPRGAVFQWDGASIPVVSALRAASGAAPLLVGWGQPEDRIHSPNESFSVRQFAAAKEWAKRILSVI